MRARACGAIRQEVAVATATATAMWVTRRGAALQACTRCALARWWGGAGRARTFLSTVTAPSFTSLIFSSNSASFSSSALPLETVFSSVVAFASMTWKEIMAVSFSLASISSLSGTPAFWPSSTASCSSFLSPVKGAAFMPACMTRLRAASFCFFCSSLISLTAVSALSHSALSSSSFGSAFFPFRSSSITVKAARAAFTAGSKSSRFRASNAFVNVSLLSSIFSLAATSFGSTFGILPRPREPAAAAPPEATAPRSRRRPEAALSSFSLWPALALVLPKFAKCGCSRWSVCRVMHTGERVSEER